jgi:hypothetical protein
MGDLIQQLIILIVLLTLIVIIWSKVQHQKVIDTVNELKEIVKGEK